MKIGLSSHRPNSSREERRRRSNDCRLSVIALLLFCVMGFGATVDADLYIYRDNRGNMAITDSPPDNVKILDVVKDKGGRFSGSSGFRDIDPDASQIRRPKSDIEKASLAPVLQDAKVDSPTPKEQSAVQHESPAESPVIIKAASPAFKYSDEVIRVPADIERR